MSLNTEVKGDPDSVRETVAWLKARSGGAQDTATQVYGARGMSESSWEGEGGGAFRSAMTQAGDRIDTDADDLKKTAGALDTHADDLHTVRSRMQQAREIAADAGLKVDGHVIHEPGPAPSSGTAPSGTSLSEASPLSSDIATGQPQIHQPATDAQAAHAAKVKAYTEASKVVSDASSKLTDSQSVLIKFLKGYGDKAPFNIADISTGLAGAVAGRTSSYREAARAMDPSIERAARYAKNWKANPFAQARADSLEIERRLAKQANLDKAIETRTARMVDKLPSRTKRLLTAKVGGSLADNANSIASPVLRNSTKVLGNLPVVGAGITAGGVGLDIGQGEDPAKAITSGASSYVAGSLATAGVAAAGGPVGWGVAAGAVVSVGVGFAVDEWGDDIASGIGSAASSVGDAGSAVGDFVGDLF